MRSARHDDRNSRARLVHVAVEMIGREGIRAATVRRVAEASGVSAPLILHHFGSKEGLLRACDEHVTVVMEAGMRILGEGGGGVTLQALLELEGAGEAVAYIGRSLQDGGDAGRRWFDRMLQMTLAGMDDLTAAGSARPTDDPTMRALLLMSMDLGMVLARPHVERALGAGLTDPAIVERWLRAGLDLLTNGVMIEGEAA